MKLINKKKVNDLVANKKGVLVDIRSPVDFRNGHIKDSKNLPLRNFINSLPGFDKKVPLILIVNNISVDTDLKTIDTYAVQLGFEKIYATEYKQLLDEDNN